jgi:predicted CoA-binding protein
MLSFTRKSESPSFTRKSESPGGNIMGDIIREALEEAKTIAVVGLSDKEERPSFQVASYLKEKGYRIIPVNPMIDEVLGTKSYADLSEIPEKVDLVDVFRKSEYVLPIAEQAIKIGVRFFWMQEGVVNEEAKSLLESKGIRVIMDACTLKEHMKLME